MRIVDAQVHIWAADSPERPWPARHKPHRPVPITRDDLLREIAAAVVDRVVLVPPSWEGERNDVVLAAAQAHPDRFAVMGRLDPEAPASRAAVRTWREQPGMLGLRFTFLQPHQKTWPTDGTIDWLWPAAERAGLPIALLAFGFLPKLAQVAERHPRLRLIIDHLGRSSPAMKDEAAWATLPDMLALAKHPNVAIKATGAPSYSSQPYPFRNIHGYLRQIYDAFGPERMFWGTDITRMPCSWRQCVTLFTEELPWLSARDKELIMGRALCAWLHWKLPRP